MRKTGVYIMSICLAALLPGCFLLPKEAEIPAMPMVAAYEAEEFKLTEVVRGDLEWLETVTCSYAATREQSLAFLEAGLRYGGIYVEAGSVAREGELVAELDMSAIDEETEAIDKERESLARELEYAVENLELSEKAAALGGADDTGDYSARINELTDEIYVLELRRSELDQLREQGRLYAGISGTVTYVKSVGTDSLTQSGSTVVTISDRSTSVFEARTEYYNLLNEGDTVEISVGNGAYSAVVTPPEALSYNASEPDAEGKVMVYLTLSEEADIGTGAKGTFQLLVDSRKDVLILQRKAIVTAGGKSMVYYQDDDGLRSIKEVQTGLTTKDYVEITGGLEEGDLVILS